jgi:hypothetical protein
MRYVFVPVITAAAFLATAAVAQEPSTTRIETRPFYGATVTLESGVRVFRPLPSHDRVIINPGGKTPLYLGYEDKRSTSRNYNYNYSEAASQPVLGADGYPIWTGAGAFIGRHNGGKGHHGGSHGGHGGHGGGVR